MGVVLVTPFDSLTAVAQHHYPWLPVRWLLSHPFDALGRAPPSGRRCCASLRVGIR